MSVFVVQLDNLPYRASEDEIIEFLRINPSNVSRIKMVKNDRGQANGNCFVEINNQEDAEKALALSGSRGKLDRMISVMKSTTDAMNCTVIPVKTRGKWDGTVRLYGFTYDSTIATVLEFCQGVDVLPGKVLLAKDQGGRHSGNAFVQCTTFHGANTILTRHKNTLDSIGRYIDCEHSSHSEYRKALLANKRAELMHPPTMPDMQYMQGNNILQQAKANMPTVNYGGLNFDAAYAGRGGCAPQNAPPQNGIGANSNGFGTFGGAKTGGPMAGNCQMPAANTRQTPYSMPPMHQPNIPKEQTSNPPPAASGSPFSHIVAGRGFPEGVTNSDIQDFFRPFRAIAVKLETDNTGDIAFKTHADCLGAMDKQGALLKNCPITLILKSKSDDVEIQRGGGWTQQ